MISGLWLWRNDLEIGKGFSEIAQKGKLLGREKMVEIEFPEYTDVLKKYFIFYILMFTFPVVAMLVLFVIVDYNPLPLLLSLLFLGLFGLWLYLYYYIIQTSIVIGNKSLTLKSLKKKINIQINDILQVKEIPKYMVLKTNKGMYKIRTQNINTRNKIIVELLKRNIPIINMKGQQVTENYIDYKNNHKKIKKFISFQHWRFYIISRRIYFSSIVILFISGMFIMILDNIFEYIFIENYYLYRILIITVILSFIIFFISLLMMLSVGDPLFRKLWERKTQTKSN